MAPPLKVVIAAGDDYETLLLLLLWVKLFPKTSFDVLNIHCYFTWFTYVKW
jgi:hypothetical protein